MVSIRTESLTKQYGSVHALHELDLVIEEGEVFGFLGPNGAGKTTTIDLLLDFIRPTNGTATVCGYDAQEETDEVRARVGILPDGFDLWERSSGRRHLEFAIKAKGANDDPDYLLERVGLDRADAERNVSEYSKGMRQRLGMAMAIAGDPDLLILDEPSTGLDPHGIRRMRDIITEAAGGGTTVFFSSHILGQVAAVADRVGILDDGKLVATDTIAGLQESAGIGDDLVLSLDRPYDGDLTAIDGVVDTYRQNGALRVRFADPKAKGPVVHRLVDDGVTVQDLTVEEATLEDLFEAYTNGGVNA